MPKPKAAPDLTPKPYRLLKSDLAAKLSPRSQGGIAYLLLADDGEAPDLHIAVTENVGGGGLWSKEAVSLTTIEAVLDAYGDQPFPTKALRGTMVGRSSNNPPFCLAVLKDLELVAPAPDKAHQHVKAGDWAAFRAEWLAKPGERVTYPEPTPDIVAATLAASSSASNEAEPASPGNARGKKRKKVAEMGHATAADETGADDRAPAADLTTGEADHAPTAHA